MEVGLSRARAADRISISKHAAYKILRYKLQALTDRQKDAIRKRDKYRCRIYKLQCVKGDGKLHVHHKGDPTDDSPKNLISLFELSQERRRTIKENRRYFGSLLLSRMCGTTGSLNRKSSSILSTLCKRTGLVKNAIEVISEITEPFLVHYVELLTERCVHPVL